MTPERHKQEERNPYPSPTQGDFDTFKAQLEAVISNAVKDLRDDIQDVAAGQDRLVTAVNGLVDWKHELEVKNAGLDERTNQRLTALEKRADDADNRSNSRAGVVPAVLLGLLGLAVNLALWYALHH